MSKELANLKLKAETVYRDYSQTPFIKRLESRAEAAISSTISFSEIMIKDLTTSKVRFLQILPKHDFIKISKEHGRSMTEAASNKSVIWGGKLKGDIYGARRIKGTALYQGLDLQKTEVGFCHLRTKGLMEDACVNRLIRSSKFLRENGLPTEKPTAIKELKELIWPDFPREKRRIEEWKNGMSVSANEGLYWKYQTNKYLKKSKYVAVEMDLQVDERLADLDYITNLANFMKPILKWLNVATRVREDGLISETPKPEKFTTSKASLQRYFTNFLPSQMGTYLGRMHKLGVAHKFTHSQNWSIVGTLYDLDSMCGKPLFPEDQEQGIHAFAIDISESLSALTSTIGQASYLLGISEPRIKTIMPSVAVLLKSYIKERFGKLTGFKRLAFSKGLVFFVSKNMRDIIIRSGALDE